MMKKIIALLLGLTLVVGNFNITYGASDEIHVVLNNEAMTFSDSKPYMENDRVLLPLRFVTEKMGAQVLWYGDSKTITITKDNHRIALSIGEAMAVVNDTEFTLDMPAILKEDRTYVPIRFISEGLGAEVTWSADTKTVSITSREKISEEVSENKKVYALYHGFRRTREHDGDLGTWKYSANSPKSVTDLKYINYNADLVDEDGNHQMTSANGGPIVGMQSEIDPDYIEYKMQLAKISHIDGFMIDFGFPEYGNMVLLNAFRGAAEKYNMEIGVNWCDNWLYYDWITYYRDDIKTREDKTEYFKTSIQFLLDNVYNQPTAATINNSPVIFLFGGGPTAAELKDILSKDYKLPNGLKKPTYIRRVPLEGKYADGQVKFGSSITTAQQWLDAGVDVHSWIAPRPRPIDGTFPYWDTYATTDDVLKYNEEYSKLWTANKKINVNTACVTPGFDNRGCAAWGGGKYYGIDRDGGELYSKQWDYFIQNKNMIDLMFIASWSDFTEGHEIEPTKKYGYTELETTLEKAAQFKDNEYNENEKVALKLPERIFNSKKSAKHYEKIGFDINEVNSLLEKASDGIGNGAYKYAEYLITKAEILCQAKENDVVEEKITVTIPSNDVKIVKTEPKVKEIDPNMIIKGKEIAQGKPVKTNSELSSGSARNAVDGIVNDSSRWVTSSAEVSYWLEINLGKPYTLAAAELYTGKDEGSWALDTVKLQYLNDRKWEDIEGASVKGNSKTNTDLKWLFKKNVTTSKVRLLCDDGSRGVRLREIKIFEQGTLDDLPKPPIIPDMEKSFDMTNGLFLTLGDEVTQMLKNNTFTGYIHFDYFGDDSEKFKITASCDRPLPQKIGNGQGNYGIVADIKKDPTMKWESCKVKLFQDNLAFNHDLTNNADFLFEGTGKVKDIYLEFTIYKKVEKTSPPR